MSARSPTPVLVDREIQLIQTFIVPSKRERYIGFASAPKRRPKLIRELDHFVDLDPKYVVPLDAKMSFDILGELVRRGAPATCYVISSNSDLDGRTMPLSVALGQVHCMEFGTIICCVPGRLAYFNGESMKSQYILERIGG
jgi:hypothetical protein